MAGDGCVVFVASGCIVMLLGCIVLFGGNMSGMVFGCVVYCCNAFG